jgi:hypothetical protein
VTDPTQTPSPSNAPITGPNLTQDLETIVADGAQAFAAVGSANLWTAIVGFFTALPGLVQMALAFWGWVNKVSGNNPGTLIANFGAALGKMQAAETQADRDAALQSISDLFPNLPS